MNLRLPFRFVARVFPLQLLAVGAVWAGLQSRLAAEAVEAVFTSATAVPVTAASYTAAGKTVDLTLNFAPPIGTNLTVVNNTGLELIHGTFDNLAQGQRVNLAFNGIVYPFVATYSGGTGNDLVLVWGNTRLASWGANTNGLLGDGSGITSRNVPAAAKPEGALDGETLLELTSGTNCVLGLGSGGRLLGWGSNDNGQLGLGHSDAVYSPVAVPQTGDLAGKTVTRLAAGFYHSLALCSDGSVVAWGSNAYGQLGTGGAASNAPVAVDTSGILKDRKVMAISVGGGFNLAICEGGLLAAWGKNDSGELGDGSTTNRATPVWVNRTGVLAGKAVVKLATAGSSSVVLCSDGTLAAWGYNANGELGDGTFVNRTTPVLVSRSGVLAGKTVTAISGKSSHFLALCADGTLAAWGYNSYGGLGNGTTTHSATPVLVNRNGVLAGKTVTGIAATMTRSLAVCADGTLVAWGENGGGLGNGSSVNSSVPVLVNSSGFAPDERPIAVTAAYSSYALVATPPAAIPQTLTATGVGDTTAVFHGQINPNGAANTVYFEYGLTTAYGTTVAATPGTLSGTAPTAVEGAVSGLLAGATYHYRVVASGTGGTAKGADQSFTTSDDASLAGLSLSAGALVPGFESQLTAYTLTVGSGVASTTVIPTALHADARVWVNGVETASGTSSITLPLGEGDNPIAVKVVGVGGVTQTYRVLVTRFPAVLAFDSDTRVPVTVNGYQPVGSEVSLVLNHAPAIGANLIAIRNNGGEVVPGTFDNLGQWEVVYLPYGGKQYRFVANYYGGDGNDLVLESGGERLLGWGYNSTGQVGDGTTTDRKVPTPVGGDVLTDKILVRWVVGSDHDLALCADGTLAAWGYGIYGQLGDGSYGTRTFPVPVDRSGVLAGRTIIALAAGTSSLALCSDGEIAAWGYNFAGQVGDGTTTNRSRPVLVDRSGVLAGRRVMSIATGSAHCLALCGDGSVVAWGNNDNGELGDGSMIDRSSPVLVDRSGDLAGKTVLAISCGTTSSHALCSDGTIASWGKNDYGQLGLGLTSDRQLRPALAKMVGALAGRSVASVVGSGVHCVALCTDGSLASWGNNYSASLGNGTSGADSLVPVAVDRSGVLAGKVVTRIAGHGNIALCADGTLAMWGYNYYGQLGINNTTNQTRPVLPLTTNLKPGEKWIDAVSMGSGCLGVVASQPVNPPVPETLAAADVTRTSATLNGRVNANGLNTLVSFEYGLTTAYGFSAPQTPITMNGNSAVPVSAGLSGLQPDRTYHFRVVAKAGSHTLKGADQTFTTSDSAVLANLSLNAGALQPGFDSDRVSYAVTVPYATTRLALAAVPKHPDATVRINGAVVASGQSGPELALDVGNTPVDVLVTGVGGEALTYKVVVTRLPASFDFTASNAVPVTAVNFQAVGEAVFSLGFTPALGTVLTAVNNTGNTPIAGRFTNLRQWQTVNLTYGGVTYQFVADYFGGTGNDLVLRWGHQRLLAWGYNGSGQVGDGTTTNRATPVAAGLMLEGGRTVVAAANGGSHSLALRSDGVLLAWGSNDNGQVGTGDKIASNVPVPVDTEGELAGKTIISLAIGSSTSFALTEDGALFAWGSGYGLLPGRVAMNGALAGKSIASFAVGSSRRLALCADGTLAEWLDTGTSVSLNQSGALVGKEVCAIAVGGGHSMALCADGTLTAWGAGSDGQVGSTEPANQLGGYPLPVVVSRSGVLAGKTIQSIAAGSNHSLALCTDGTLVSWGDNYYGQLGNGTTTDAKVPGLVTVSGVLAGKTVTAISAGSQHSLALCSDGTLAAWGYNYNGEVGDGTTTSRSAPVLVLNGERRTGERIGRLVGGLSSDSMVITAMPPPPVAESLAATGLGDTAATLNGRVNGSGASTTVSFEYGLTTAYGSTVAGVPATVAGSADTALSAALVNLLPGTTYHYRVVASGPGGVVKGADQTLATTDIAKLVSLTVDGAAAFSPAFGAGVGHYETTVANATTSVTVTPVAAAAGAVVKVNGSEVAADSASGPLALAAGSNIIAITVTVAGESRTYEVVVTRLPAALTFASAAAVPATAAGFSVGGLPATLGLGFAPSAGIRLTVLKNTGTEPIQGTFANLAQWQVVNLSYNNIQYPFVANYFGGTGNDLVLEWAGQRLLAWGHNGNGRLGDGSTVNRTIPGAVGDGALAGKWIVRSVAGGAHNLALGADGTLAAWGANASGQLGTGDTVDRSVPVRVDMTGVLAGKIPISLAAGDAHNLVLCSDGTLAAWGLNDKGQLGDGTTTNRPVPVRVDQTGVLAGKAVVAIVCGGSHCMVWCSDGTLAAWGDNSSGQLGDGTAVSRTAPVRVNQAGVFAGKTIAAIASGSAFNLVWCTDGSLVTWGDNPYGQLGNGTKLDSATPVLADRSGVLAGKTVTAIACGGAHCLALCSDGTLAAWGSTGSGQLGQGTIYDYTGKWVPVLVTRTGVLSGKTVAAIAGGNSHSLALCSDGTLTAWGNNNNGELGNNSTTTTAAPVLVTTTALRAGERWAAIGGGSNHSLAAVAQPVPPVVETLAASNVKDGSATLAGRVSGNGNTTAVSFEYGFTTSYGSSLTATPASVSGTTATAVSAALGGLLPGTVYHFRCVGTLTGRAVYGGDQTFTTTSLASLAGLTPGAGVLLPAFDPGITRYDVTLADAEISLTLATLAADATITVNGTPVEPGVASPAIALNPGSNTINVVVTGSGDNSRTYQVVATRMPTMMTFSSAADVAATAGGFAVDGLTADFALNFTPVAGTRLTVLKNTGNLPIQGRFTNLADGQEVVLEFGGVGYPFIATYRGGDGNDLALEWKSTPLLAWGANSYGQLGDGTTTTSGLPVLVDRSGVLAGKTVTAAATGDLHGLALCADGTLAAWGYNNNGQLGDGTTTARLSPVAVDRSGLLANKTITAIAAGSSHNLALCADGTLAAWGHNGYAQLGDGTTADRTRPVAVNRNGVLAGKTITAIAAGDSYSLALCADGTLAAWGDNYYGQLGDGTTLTTYSSPVLVNRGGVLAGKTITAITVGWRCTFALCSDGTLAAWGMNDYGQLGDGTTTNRSLPVLVDRSGVLAGKTVIAAAAADYHGLALCSDGTLAAWGNNSYGQLGDGTTTNRSRPVLVVRSGVLVGKTITVIAPGKSHNLALCSDGTLAAWGYNDNGQLGDGTTINRLLPVLVDRSGRLAGTTVTSIAAGGSSLVVGALPPPPVPETLAATSVTGRGARLEGRVSPSGNSIAVAFEYGLTTSYGSTVAAVPATATGTSPVSVSASLTGLLPATTYHYRVAVTRAGTLFYGEDASFTTSDALTLANLAVDGGSLFPGFAPSQTVYHLTAKSEVAGITLTPTTTQSAATVRINGQEVASGTASETLPLAVGGNSIAVVVTGDDGGTLTYQVTATRLPASFDFPSASVVPVTAGALTAVGEAVISLDFAPPAGTDLTVVNNTGVAPIQGRFANLAQWQVITLSFGGLDYPFVVNYYGGSGNDLVLEWGDRRLMAWGYNGEGNLGDGSFVSRMVAAPVLPGVLAGKTIVRVAAGGDHCLALASDGTLAAWGDNAYGQLGDHSLTDRTEPVTVDISGVLAGKTIIGLAACGNHSVAVCEDGTVATWGANDKGQLGDGTMVDRQKPVQVNRSGALAGKVVTAVSTSRNSQHCLALCADGTLVAWGDNAHGQLGDGTGVSSPLPVRVNQAGVLAGKTITTIAAGRSHSAVLCGDGTVVTWGYNLYGNLGDGTTTERLVPTAVVSSGVLAGKTVVGLSTSSHTCLVRCSDGTLATWGYGNYGQLGNGQSTYAQTTPVSVTKTGVLSGKTPMAMASGTDYHLVGCADGTLVAWGYNGSGQLGDGSTTNRSTPVLVAGSALRAGERTAAVSAGNSYSLVLVASPPPPILETLPATGLADASATLHGRVTANGTATAAAFEYGLTESYGMTATAVPSGVNGTTPAAVSAAISGLLSGTTYHFRVISPGPGGGFVGEDETFTTTNMAALAGLSMEGGALQPEFSPNQRFYHASVANTTSAVTLTPITADAAAVVTVNGSAVDSGAASRDITLVVGTTTITVEVSGAGGTIRTYQVAITRLPAGFEYSSATTVPVSAENFAVDGLSANISLNFVPAPGTRLTVLENTGTAPIKGRFANLAQWQEINLTFGGISYAFVANYAGGTGNDLVLEWANRRLLGWGWNYYGEVGDGTTLGYVYAPIPVADGVLAGKTVVRASAGNRFSVALATDGTLAAWGKNSEGQLGDNSTTNRSVPSPVNTTGVLAGKTIIALDSGYEQSLVLCDDGTLAGWGTGFGKVPVLVDQGGVLAGKTVTAICCGGSHQMALCSDGSLVAWGSNVYGQLGDGSTISRANPVLVNQTGVLAGKSIVAISGGGAHSVVLCADGTLVSWGQGDSGQLGTNSSGNSSVPVLVNRSGVLAGKTITAITAGGTHSVALCSDGSLAAWGTGSYGQLGDGSSTSSLVPVLVARTGVLAGKSINLIESGRNHSFAGCADGSLAAWGDGSTGQLGDGQSSSRYAPVLVSASALRPGEGFGGVAAGESHNIALVVSPSKSRVESLAASDVADTSATLNGLVGASGTTATAAFEYGLTTAYGSTAIAVPATLSGSLGTQVAAQLTGLLSGTTYHFRVRATGPGGTATGPDQTFTTTELAALKGLVLSDGALLPNLDPNITSYHATVGQAIGSINLTPKTTHPDATVTVNGSAVASGAASGPIALAEGNTTVTIIVSGPGGAIRIYQLVVTRLPETFTFASDNAAPVTAPGFAINGLKAGFALNFAPVPGTGLTVLNNTGAMPIEGRFTGLAQWQTVNLRFGGITYPFVANYSGGDGNDLVLEWANRRLLGWGKNDVGQVDDTLTNRTLPTAVTAGVLAGKTIIRIACGDNHNLALCTDGTLAAWGENGTGQLGDGSTMDRSVPILVETTGVLAGKQIVAIAAGAGHSLALCSDGTLAAWGDNTAGQLGDSTNINRSRPVRVDLDGVLAGKTITALAAGTNNSLALCSDGTLAAWGLNNYSQLGTGIAGTNSGSNIPYPTLVDRTGVLAGKTVTSIAVGNAHGLVCCSDGTLAAWGRNYEGQLGENTTTFQENSPVLVNRSGVLAGKTPVAVVAGYNHSLVMCSDGTLAGFGDSASGQLGNGSAGSYVKAPVLVKLDTALAGKAVVSLRAGSYHNAALCADASLVTWGSNYHGGLGDGSTTNKTSPTLVATSTLRPGERFFAISAGQYHTLALVASSPPPMVNSLAASDVGESVATLRGDVNASGTTVEVAFEYGLTISYGSSAAASPTTVSGATAVPVSATLTGLLPGLIYHYRVVAAGPGGVVASGDMTFATTDLSTLADLTLDGAPLSPAFAPATFRYLATVPFGTENVHLTPTAAHAGATILVNGAATASGSGSQPLALAVGANPLTVTVTAEGGAVTTYTVVVTRLPEVFSFGAPSAVPLVLDGFAPAGLNAAITLDFAPQPGVSLTLVDNTGASPIAGTFANLRHGQRVDLSFGGTIYPFVADYFGGTGNDLVLRWANNRLLAWGNGSYGNLGGGSAAAQASPAPVLATGVLRGKTLRAIATGNDSSVALCVDGTLATWGTNRNGQLGTGSGWSELNQSAVPLAVDQAGVLAGKMVTAIASGYSHCLALCADGTLAAWGVNNYGQLGNGATTDAPAPVLVDRTGVLAGKSIIAIAAGGNHNLALCGDGTLAAWGYSNNGQVGDGTTGYRTTPVLVDRSGLLAGRTVTAIAAGGSHNLALCADGTLAAWGNNSSAQLGDNSTTARTTPVRPRTGALAGKTVRAIAAGSLHSLALCSDGTLVAWGANTSGELGDGTTTQRRVPTLVDQTGVLAGRTVTQIDAGSSHSLALCADGFVAGWGDDYYGQLTTAGDALSPVEMSRGSLLDSERVTSLAGFNHNLLLASSPVPPLAATLAATGILDTGGTLNGSVIPNGNSNVILGFEYGPTTDYGFSIPGNPAAVDGGGTVATSAVLSGLTPGVTYHYRCVASADAGVTLGGDATFTTTTFGTLADLSLSDGGLSPTFSSLHGDYVATVPFGVEQLAVTAVPAHSSSAVTVNGAPVAAGAPSVPIALAVGGNVIELAVIAADGLNTRAYRLTVTRLPGTLAFDTPETVPATAAGFRLSGNAPPLSLGYQPQPGGRLVVLENTGITPIHGTFANLAQGQSVALTYRGTTTHFVVNYFGGTGNDLVLEWANRRLLVWGDNATSQLGTGTATDQPAPVPVNMAGILAGKTVIEIAAGYHHTLALCSDGTVAAWGDNWYGELGDGTTVTSQVAVPVRLAGVLDGKRIIKIAAGSDHSLALCTDGTLVSWGQNSQGELGDGTTINRLAPVQVDQTGILANKAVVKIAAGERHCLVLCGDGSLVAWGDNSDGQLGDGTTTRRVTPVQVNQTTVLAGKAVVGIAAGAIHNLVLCSDGTVAGWGFNYNGQLGTGDTNSRSVPVAMVQSGVLLGKTPVAISAGTNHSLIACADGTVAACGYNEYGKLGDGTTTDRKLPVVVNPSATLVDRLVTGVGTGYSHSVAWCADGTAVAWGRNSDGQLGTNLRVGGSLANSLTPASVDLTDIISGERIVRIDAGLSHNLALSELPLPQAATFAATAVTGVGGTLHGSVNAIGNQVGASFEYGPDETYGSVAMATPAEITGMADTPVSAVLTGLKPGTTYHYRVAAACLGGVARSTDMTFTTLSDNAWLADLAHDGGVIAPHFDSRRLEYFASVPYETAAVTVSAVLDHPRATCTINGAAGNVPVPLGLGANRIAILVTAEDGVSTKSYSITVTRLPQEFVFNTASDIPLTSEGFAPGGNPVKVVLGFAPTPGTVLTMVDNTGLAFIHGKFGNLAHGQRVSLIYGGKSYDFIASYHGGTGNDLVLQWATTELLAWGGNGFGQLGDNTTERRLVPTPVSDSGVLDGKTVLSMAGGYLHSLALCSDGTLAAWGYNVFGQLGTGLDTNSSVPLTVDQTGVLEGKVVVAISAGPFHNLALCEDGTVVAWGYNNHGQIGDGTRMTRRQPVVVPRMGALASMEVVAVVAGVYQSFALGADGTVAAWGYNDEGELGNGSTTGSLVPVSVDRGGALAGKRVASLAVGRYHTLALCTDGTLAAWGYNKNGQLGNSSTVDASSPVVIGGQGVLAGRVPIGISAGGSHSLAWCADGTLAAWGANDRGQLGAAGSNQSSLPLLADLTGLVPGSGIVGLAAGGTHSILRRADGRLAAWGDNANGQLGDASLLARATPSTVGSITGHVMAVASGAAAQHNLALLALPIGSEAIQGDVAADLAGEDLIGYAFQTDHSRPGHGQLPEGRLVNGEFVIGFTQPTAVNDVIYAAEWSITMQPGTWQEVPDTGSGMNHRFAIPATGATRGFIRLKVSRAVR
ncbi:MAG: cadherin-like beta sandwich domain-containing protein [Verrucomicrobia bacterium]|nr:cadherin-like beta sandwich domain-containing protein [Verrucomicrobiota bacterium]